jgi:hypothetical protein
VQIRKYQISKGVHVSNITDLFKRNLRYLSIYLVCYGIFVWQLVDVNGVWHWNLFSYFGYVNYGAFTLVYFILLNIATWKKDKKSKDKVE